jgi:hypothetical protein
MSAPTIIYLNERTASDFTQRRSAGDIEYVQMSIGDPGSPAPEWPDEPIHYARDNLWFSVVSQFVDMYKTQKIINRVLELTGRKPK